jgi:hypothetical protein
MSSLGLHAHFEQRKDWFLEILEQLCASTLIRYLSLDDHEMSFIFLTFGCLFHVFHENKCT